MRCGRGTVLDDVDPGDIRSSFAMGFANSF